MFSPWLHQMALDRPNNSTDKSMDPALSSGQIQIRLINAELTLARVSRVDLEQCLKPLLQLALYPTATTFFSFTEVDGEVSLVRALGHFVGVSTAVALVSGLISTIQTIILDSASAQLFPDDILTQTGQKWKAIEIYEGEAAIDQTGIVRRFSEPLARAGIQIIYLSAYYSDLILVEESSTEAAMTCLQGANRALSSYSAPLPKFNFISADSSDDAGDDNTSAFLGSIPTELIVACFPRRQLSELSHNVLRLLLFPPTEERFFSFTSYGAEVSLIIQKSELESFGDSKTLMTNANTWEALHVQPGPSGVTGTGVVTSASSVLADKNVSIFYLSTFNTDYILVPSSLAADAIQYLQRSS